jgi:eukaryotic-like serine/threonine-protein kinase
MSCSIQDEEAVFKAARRIADPVARRAYLGEVCRGEETMFVRVQAMLRVEVEDEKFMAVPAVAAEAGRGEPNLFPPGTRIGPYLLREQIGEGGMGLVFVADQEQPVRRRVALKVVKPGMDSKTVLARFEAERQALALMDHPNIAKVLDAGVTESGRPYFVMELVRGVPITDYCDEARLTPRQRLDLFLAVCRAIQHAHRKGVIHRDIKPSNVLVTLYDAHPVPKVIDFGIAKAVGTAFAGHSVYTGFAQLVGTPMYMSPEQAEMTAQDVDTRADVYALGVVLYELLTGTTPFDGETLRQAGFDEMRRIIREDEPARPSHRVTTMAAEKQSTVSGQRGVDGRQLGRQLRGGLDWVVMTCLAKDRTRRYESAGALAADIERYMRDEPVAACPPSTSYRLRTFSRRNRRALATVGVIGAALVAATAVSVWQAVKARDAQNQAETERDLAKAAQRETAAAENRAATEAAIARAVNDFLQKDLLRIASPQVPLEGGPRANPVLNVRAALDRAAAKIDERFRDQPLVEAEMRLTIADAYRGIWEPAKAVPQLQQAVALRKAHLGPGHRDTLFGVHTLELAYEETGYFDDALALLVEWREHFQSTFGPDGQDARFYLHAQARASYKAGKLDDAERSERALLEIQRKTDSAMGTVYSQMWMSRIHLRQGKYRMAEAAAREALAILEQETQEPAWIRYVAMTLLGGALVGREKYSAAEPLLLKGYEGLVEWEATFGPHSGNWRRTEAIERLVWLYEATDQPEKARAWREKLSPMK